MPYKQCRLPVSRPSAAAGALSTGHLRACSGPRWVLVLWPTTMEVFNELAPPTSGRHP